MPVLCSGRGSAVNPNKMLWFQFRLWKSLGSGSGFGSSSRSGSGSGSGSRQYLVQFFKQTKTCTKSGSVTVMHSDSGSAIAKSYSTAPAVPVPVPVQKHFGEGGAGWPRAERHLVEVYNPLILLGKTKERRNNESCLNSFDTIGIVL